jgi:integrase
MVQKSPFTMCRHRAQPCSATTSSSATPARAGLPRPKSAAGWFQAAVKKAKVQKITPHDLRHTCASLAVSPGVNVLALQRMLGHTSAKMTLDAYADLFDDDLDAVATSLHARYSREVTRTCAQNVPTERLES